MILSKWQSWIHQSGYSQIDWFHCLHNYRYQSAWHTWILVRWKSRIGRKKWPGQGFPSLPPSGSGLPLVRRQFINELRPMHILPPDPRHPCQTNSVLATAETSHKVIWRFLEWVKEGRDIKMQRKRESLEERAHRLVRLSSKCFSSSSKPIFWNLNKIMARNVESTHNSHVISGQASFSETSRAVMSQNLSLGAICAFVVGAKVCSPRMNLHPEVTGLDFKQE